MIVAYWIYARPNFLDWGEPASYEAPHWTPEALNRTVTERSESVWIVPGTIDATEG